MGDVIRHVNPPSVSPPKGEYTHAVVLESPAAKLCFVGGQVGFGPGGEVASTFEGQVENTFENLRVVLESVGSSYRSVLQLTTYLTSDTLIDRYFAKRAELFPQLFTTGFPANALVIVAGLARPALEIEIQAVAAIPTGDDD